MHFLTQTARRTGYQAILLAALASNIVQSASAAQQIYFQLEGSEIASDHLSETWEGWIAGRAFGQSYTQSSVGTSVPTLDQDFHIVKRVDKATPLLARAMLEGRAFPKLTVVYLTAEESSEPPVKVELQNVAISSHRLSGDVDRLTEDVAFTFDSAQFRYTPGTTGSPQDPAVDELDPFGEDSNRDGLPDTYAKAYGLNDSEGDLDGDGLTNGQELAAGSAPNDRHSRFGIEQITLLREKPGRGCIYFQTLPGREYRLMGSPTGQNWFELHRLHLPVGDEAGLQEIELSFSGLTQLLRVEVSLKR